MNPIHVPNDGGRNVEVLGNPLVIRIHGRDTGRIVSVVESHDVPGGGPPPHIHHREDETFQIPRRQQQQDIPRVMEIAKKLGLEILPPSGA